MKNDRCEVIVYIFFYFFIFTTQSIGLNELSRIIYEIFSVKLSIKSYEIYGDKNM